MKRTVVIVSAVWDSMSRVTRVNGTPVALGDAGSVLHRAE
jgi:hypothetical protein